MKSEISMFKQHYIEILSIVSKKGPCKKEDVYEELNGSKMTKVNHINELIEAKLIRESPMGQYNKKIITITEKGIKILNQMLKIQAIIDDEPMEPKTNCGAPSEEIDSSTTAE